MLNFFLLCAITTALVASDDVVTVSPNVTTTVPPAKKPVNDLLLEIALSEQFANATVLLQSSMDTSVEPCDDFFAYACGRWQETDRGVRSVAAVQERYVKYLVKESLQHLLLSPDALLSESRKKLKLLYSACILGAEDPNETANSRLTAWLQEHFGISTWPISSSSLPTASIESLAGLMKNHFDVDLFFSLQILPDMYNTSVHLPYLGRGHMGLSTSLNLSVSSEDRDDYQMFMFEVGRLLNAENLDVTQTVFEQLIEFEAELTDVINRDAQLSDDLTDSYHPYSTTEFDSKFSPFSFTNYFKSAFPALTDVQSQFPKAISSEPDYLRNITSFLADWNSTPERKTVVFNYIVWRFIGKFLPYIGGHFTLVYHNYSNKLPTAKLLDPRVDFCLKFLDDSDEMLSHVVGRVFVDRFFSPLARLDVADMSAQIRAAFLEILNETDWLDDVTKAKALLKLEKMIFQVGNPRWIEVDQQLDSHYAQLQLANISFSRMAKKLIEWNSQGKLAQILQPVDRFRLFDGSPTEDSAWYEFAVNSVVYPAGYLQLPIYHPIMPLSFLYGGVGTAIGHEITHAFDDSNARLGPGGNHENWWTDDSWQEFRNRTRCLLDQYTNFCYPHLDNICLTNKISPSEDMADLSGVQSAYRAYGNAAARETHRLRDYIPVGLEQFSRDQMFFLSYAFHWCDRMDEDETRDKVLTGSHSPSRDRVNGPLSNFSPFAEAFECQVGSAMNPIPDKQCEVW